MAISVTSATHAQAQDIIQPAAARQSAPAAKPQPPSVLQPAATVQISAAAQALQEAIETPVQTAKEASTGDAQAKRLLAREASANAVRK